MNKNQTFKFKWKNIITAVLISCCLFCESSGLPITVAHADEIAEEQLASSISLDYVSDVAIHTPDSILRLYGEPEQTYQVPVNVSADCTIILDHIKNTADFTIADGVHVKLLLRGSNECKQIIAAGGTQTELLLIGDSADAMLTAEQIACTRGGTTQTGANVRIESCTVVCQDLGCGNHGLDNAYNGGSAMIPNAMPGSNASANVTIISSQVMISGSLACGGNGVSSQGSWAANASNGGCAGTVLIDNSRVSVGGNVAMGGKGGDGGIGSSYYEHVAGNTQSACPVQIINNSYVTVTGNVASQQDLPKYSKDGKQQGLHGVKVEITDSTLIAKDIASGGNGHQYIRSASSSGAGTSYDIAGTAGGNGGTIVAKNAVIECNTAVRGGNAGEYMNYQVSMYGNQTGDYDCANHPIDGNGGSIDSSDSQWTIHSCTGEKGSRWSGYSHPSTYSDQRFSGGMISGRVRGAVITTDLTTICDGDFEAATEVRNSEEASCAKCLLKTDMELAGTTAAVTANELRGSARLDENGQWYTYLGIGKQQIRLMGSHPYEATVRVRRSAAFNEFQLNAYGRLNMEYADALIREDSYHYLDENYDYNGDYRISGNGDHKLSIDAGEHLLIFDETTLDTLEINGNSIVRIQLKAAVTIRQILVADGATLIIDGVDFLDYDSCQGMLRNTAGQRLFPVSLIMETPDQYELCLNEEEKVLSAEDRKLHFLVPEGTCQLTLRKEAFVFTGEWQISGPQQLYQSDLLLRLDCSLAPVTIEDTCVNSGTERIDTQADVCLSQSSQLHCVSVKKKDAMLWLDHIAPNIQIYVPQDFCGEIRDCSGIPLRLVTVEAEKADYPMQFELDGTIYDVVTNADGVFTFLATIGVHEFRLILDDGSYWVTGSLRVSADDKHNFHTKEELTDQKPEPAPDVKEDQKTGIKEEPDTEPGTEPANREDTPGTNNSGSDGSSSGSSSSGSSSSGGSSSGSSSSGGSSSSSSGSGGSGSGGSNLNSSGLAGSGSNSPGSTGTVRRNHTTDHASADGIDAKVLSNLSNIRLLDSDEVSDRIIYTKKDVTFHITVSSKAACEYKLVHQGEDESSLQWNQLDNDRLTIRAGQQDRRAVAVIFRTTCQDVVRLQRTDYFCIDQKRPVIRGVRHLHFYRNSRSIRVSDNCGLREIRLNGRKVSSAFTLKKKGVYVLRVTDYAGNCRLIAFAIV